MLLAVLSVFQVLYTTFDAFAKEISSGAKNQEKPGINRMISSDFSCTTDAFLPCSTQFYD
jgi:hypothetical protein